MPMFQVNAVWAAMTEVVPNLFICGVSALKPNAVIALNFDLVVNCTKEVPNMNLPPDVERLKLWLEDTDETDLLSSLDMAVDYIRMILESDGKALVHCVAGISRSAAVCLAYLIKYESMSLRQAYEHLAARRARVRPNLGFWRQLIQYEKEYRNETSVVIKKTGCEDEELPDVYEHLFVENKMPPKVEIDQEETSSNLTNASNSNSNEILKSNSSNKLKEERKRQRQLSDSDSKKRFTPKLETLIECEQ